MIKLKDLLEVIDENIDIIIYSESGKMCGKYCYQDFDGCYFNEWYVVGVYTNLDYKEPTIEITIQEEKKVVE